MIAIPDFAAGAMENWGLITYRETAMLFKEGQSSEDNKQRVTAIISHELAHMVSRRICIYYVYAYAYRLCIQIMLCCTNYMH